MRKINSIAIHCSATIPDQDIGRFEINQWHVANGWSGIGYHFVIRRNGKLEIGRELSRAGAHVKGHNADSVGVCMVGGLAHSGKPDNNFTPEQWRKLETVVSMLKAFFPEAEIKGHRDYPDVTKACPCFDVREWWQAVQEG